MMMAKKDMKKERFKFHFVSSLRICGAFLPYPFKS
jgi:hypothetical protein